MGSEIVCRLSIAEAHDPDLTIRYAFSAFEAGDDCRILQAMSRIHSEVSSHGFGFRAVFHYDSSGKSEISVIFGRT